MPRKLHLLLIFLIPTALLAISSLHMLRSNTAPHFLDLTSFPTTALPPPPHLHKSAAALDKHPTKCTTANNQILKVFMYNLPPVFHFGLLGWKGNGRTAWPDLRRRAGDIPQYPGGLNLQHSIEYWLTLDILNSQFSKNLTGRSAVRVHDSREADVVFVPFFASISYNRFGKSQKRSKKSADDMLQEKLVQFLVAQEEWKRSGGRDHIIVAHHPNSLLYARMKLWPAIFILADLGRYPSTVANVEKDVIAPYKHLIPAYADDDSGFDGRPTLLYFQGAVYRKDVSLLLIDIVLLNFALS